MGEGPAHGQDRLRVPPPQLPVPRLGRRLTRRPVQLQSAGHGGATTARGTTSRRPAIPSRRSCSARCRSPTRRSRSIRRSTRPTRRPGSTTSSRSTTSLTLTLGTALRLPVRPHGNERSVLDLRSEHAQPGGREHPGRLDLSRDRVRAAPGARKFETPEEGRLGPAGRLRLSARREGRRSAAVTGSITPESRSTSSSASRRSASGQTRWRRTRPTASSRRSTWTRVPAGPGRAAAVHRPGLANGTARARGDAGWIDPAALPELVGDVPAPAHRQHDAGRVVHREPRQPPEPPLPDAGRGRQHERPERAGARRGRPAVEHQLAGGAGRRHHAPLSRLQRERGAGAAEVSAVSDIEWRGVPDGTQSVPRPGNSSSSGASPEASRPGSATRSPGCTTTAPRAPRATTGSTAASRIPADPLDWELSADDTPHVFLTGFTWEVPGSASWTSPVTKALLRGLERQRRSPLRERPAAQHHHEQRSWRPAVQQPEAAEPRVGRRRRGCRAETSIRSATATSTGTPGRIRVRSRSATRPSATRRCAGSPIYSEDLNIFKVFPLPSETQDAVRGPVRQHLQPDVVLRPEHELELRQLRHGQHAVQPAAVGSVRVEVRLLVGQCLADSEPGTGSGPAATLVSARCCSRTWSSRALLLARSCLSRASSLTPTRSAALQKAAALVQQGRLEEAEQQARLALADPETRAVAYSVLGAIRFSRRTSTKAPVLRKAIAWSLACSAPT